jgi:MoaA/NifB/PqqE/SkfB family radical SAM enzyme
MNKKFDIGKLKIPLLISWAVTHRCTRQCRYCRISGVKRPEMGTAQAHAVIDRLAKQGTMLICFSGGEPLVRDDIGELFAHCRKKGIDFDISSNGDLVRQKIKAVRKCRLLVISMDGPKEVHDAVRGKGAFSTAASAALEAKENGVPVYLRTVLSRHNLHCIDETLAVAELIKIPVIFQPVTKNYYGSTKRNDALPIASAYRTAMDRIIARKREGHPYIQNSEQVLNYLRRWPARSPIDCVSGKVFFHIFPDGQMTHCIWGKDPRKPEAKCDGCWDAAACNFNFSFFKRKLG